ncbi:high-affinity nitrate transporter 3.1 [Lactuca sativa]|uniref:High-affinity nitrate transporter n=1 Tax=Lactuca sativa TaxID=4236 RepID=A0A9R1VVS8_LACSA|nr:high-affinity nitrate transporter 3.1 [Lactuca sativa]KAJ0211526.1 hypothetical protein LSAT_V11C400158750 [Lactuca sativa]
MKSYMIKAFLLLVFMSKISNGSVMFSSLPPSLSVVASPNEGQVLQAGEDSITVSFGLNSSIANQTDESYKFVKVKLCYAPISQVDRKWRKTVDNLKKDKTCQFTIWEKQYDHQQNMSQQFEWRIEKDLPTATYFVRAYVYDSGDEEIGYGQTTNDKKISNLFKIQGISGRHPSIDIASICFSVFAILSLVGFFLLEKRQSKAKK